MSLRDVSNSVLLAITAERDTHALVCINNVFFYHPPVLSVEDLALEEQTWTGDNIEYILDFSRGGIKIRNCKEVYLKPSVLALC